MSKRPIRQTVRAWIADRHQAGNIPIRDLDALQKRFKGRLEIVRSDDGGMTITPDTHGDQTAFDNFMAQHTDFVPRRVAF